MASVLMRSANQGLDSDAPERPQGAAVTGLLVAAIVAHVADLVTYMRASPALVAADETSPLPHLLGQVAGGIAAKLIVASAIAVIVVAFRCRPRVRYSLLALYTVAGIFGATVNILVTG
jgi:hypothetical protein